jgi:hypothetical protein
VWQGRAYELRGDDEPVAAPTFGDMPRIPQRVRQIKREFMSIVPKVRTRGTGYKPGLLIELAHDQCKYTLEGQTMCGARVVNRHCSWCAEHKVLITHEAFRDNVRRELGLVG